MRRIAAFSTLGLLVSCQQPPAAPGAGNDLTPAIDDSAAAKAPETNSMPPFAEIEGAHPTAPEPAPIPARFRGTWAENAAACTDLSHHSRLIISGRTVRHQSFVVFGDSVTLPAPDHFALKGRIEATGVPAEAHYSINDNGTILTDGAGGGMALVRCG